VVGTTAGAVLLEGFPVEIMQGGRIIHPTPIQVAVVFALRHEGNVAPKMVETTPSLVQANSIFTEPLHLFQINVLDDWGDGGFGGEIDR
jgi:hypothetical protein